MITWALTHIPQLIFFFVLYSVVRAVARAAQLSKEHKSTTSETDEQRRVREIQERIRRKIAERRGGAAPLSPARSEGTDSPPPLRPVAVPNLDPFGGPSSRRLVIETMRRAVQPKETAAEDAAALERQQKLAAEIRALDEARILAERQAAQVMVQREERAAPASTASVHAATWIGDLRDRQALRRAIILREVLGAPVALR